MVYCIVPFCKSHSLKHTVSFHEVPSDLTRREKWTRAISREGPKKGSLWIPKERDAVCEKHFLPSDYKIGRKRKILKSEATPSIFPSYPHYRLPKVLIGRREICKHPASEKYGNSTESPQPSFNTTLKVENSVCSSDKNCGNSMQSPQSPLNTPLESENTICSSTSDSVCSVTNVNVDQNHMLFKKKIRRLTVTLSKTRKKPNVLHIEKKKLNKENRDLKKLLSR